MRRRSPARRAAAVSPATSIVPTATPSIPSRSASIAVHGGSGVSSPLEAASGVETSEAIGARNTQVQAKKRIVRPPKYHETAAFLAREAFPGSSGAETVAGGPPTNTHRVGEAYRLVATMIKDANEAERRSRVVSWGYGSTDGALAHNHTKQSLSMAPVAFFHRDNVRAAAAGDRLSVFLTYDGAVYESGRLFPTQDGCGMWRPRRITGCIGGASSEQEEQQNMSISDEWEGRRRIVAVAAGHFAAYALDESGQVYSWGTRMFGQLGHGDDPDRTGDVANPDIGDEESIGKSSNHNAADSEDNEDAGGTNQGDDAPIDSTGQEESQVEDDTEPTKGAVPFIVDQAPRVIDALRSDPIDSLAVGNHFVLATSKSGFVYSWGRNCHGQLGLGHRESTGTPTRIDALAGHVPVRIAAGHSHVIAVFLSRAAANLSAPSATEYSLVFAWGNSSLGRLGFGWTAASDELSPREVTFFRGLAACKTAAGADHSLVLCGAGGGGGAPTFVYAFGGNQFGQLGVGTLADTHVEMPTLVDELTGLAIASVGAGSRYSAALTGDGEVYSWGDARARKTSRQDMRTTFVPWQVDVPATLTMGSGFLTQLSVGVHHCLALFRTDGKMDRWRKFPLGRIVSTLPVDVSSSPSSQSSAVELMRHATCVCEHSQSRTRALFGVFLRCESCAASPVCRLCMRQCHAGHTIKPVVLWSSSSESATSPMVQCACGRDGSGSAKCMFATLPMVVMEE